MRFKIRWPAIIIGLVLILILAIGAAAVFAQSSPDESDKSGREGNRGTDQRSPSNRFGLWRHLRRGSDSVPQGPLARLWRSGVDRDQLLADALGISVAELHEARVEARNTGIQQAADDGIITQDEADLLLAVMAFKVTVDKAELLTEALGISVDELMEAREDGLRMRELLEELELSPTDVREGLKEAFEAAVEDAVLSGEITEEQADLLLNFERPGRFFRGFHPFGSKSPRGSGDF